MARKARGVSGKCWAGPTTADRGAGRLPLVAGHVEVGTQRPPHIARVDTVLDGLDGGPSAQLGQDVVHHDRGAPNSSELPVNEFAELRQSHNHEPTQNYTAARHTATGSATPVIESPARRADCR